MKRKSKVKMKKVAPLVLIAAVVIVGGLAFLLIPREEPVGPATLIDMALSKADNESLRASEAMEIGDFRVARERYSRVGSHIFEAGWHFRKGKNMLPEPERVKYRTILNLYNTSYELSIELLDWRQAWTELEGKEIVDAESALLILPEMEIFAEGSLWLADGLHRLVIKLDFAARTNPAVREWFDLRVKGWGLGLETMEEYISILEEFVLMLDNTASAYEEAILDTIIAFDLDYTWLDERMIPKIVDVPLIPPEIIPPDLAAFFDGFDFDGDGMINLGEAGAFFYWVEDNIVCRYDDEASPVGLVRLALGMITPEQLGDGRLWVEYWQTPHETWVEGAGDCEDMAILHVAFYNYFGISAYVATVATRPNGVVDHGIAVVLMGGSPEEFANLLGDLVYYEIDGEYYMWVDSALPGVFGYLHYGLEEGAFAMKPYVNGQFLFTLEEAVDMHRHIREAL